MYVFRESVYNNVCIGESNMQECAMLGKNACKNVSIGGSVL